MAEKIEAKALGKVVRVEGGFAYTDKKKKVSFRCKVGDVLVFNEKSRKVKVKEVKAKAPTAAKILEELKAKATDLGIDGVDEMDKEALEIAIKGEQ